MRTYKTESKSQLQARLDRCYKKLEAKKHSCFESPATIAQYQSHIRKIERELAKFQQPDLL